jgi:hypothetical protein
MRVETFFAMLGIKPQGFGHARKVLYLWNTPLAITKIYP